MAERQIENLDTNPSMDPPPQHKSEVVKISLNFPDPTPLSMILRDVAKWSGLSFVMEPSVNVKLQIFAPHPLIQDDAYRLFLTSLSVVGLRAVQVGQVVKIVPVTLVVAA